jgi:tape measure domain-containing protein
MSDSVDIIVSETGADDAAASLAAVSAAADQAATSVDTANQSINFLKDATASAQSPLDALASAADQGTTAFDSNYKMVYNAETGFYDIVTAAQEAAAAIQLAAEAADASGNASVKAADALGEHKTSLDHHAEATHAAKEQTEALTEATNLLKEALGFLGLALGVEKVIDMAEKFEQLTIKLSGVSKNSKELEENLKALEDISQKTGSSLTANANAFQKLAIETKGAGISQKDLLTTIEGVDQAVRLSGGTSDQAAQALNVFSRALATGSVQGRQFRTLLIQFPALGKMIADGLGEPLSALTSFSAKAPLASKDFIEAFVKASDSARKAGGEIELTLGQALTTLGNAVMIYIGQTNESTGATAKLAAIVHFLAENFQTIATVVTIAATAYGTYLAILVVIPGVINTIIAATNRLTVAVAANPLGFLAVAIVSLIAITYEYGNSVKLTSDGSITLLGAVIGLWNLLKEAMIKIWEYVGGPLTAVFMFFFNNVILAPFHLVITVINDIIWALNKIGAAIPPLSDSIVSFKEHIVDAMKEATTKLNETEEHSKTLAETLGGDDETHNVSGAAKKATTSVKGLSSAANDLGVQMGRVDASLIPAGNGLIKAAEAAKKAADEWKKYSAEVDANTKAVQANALMTQDAMGNMIKATDEWARRSGDDYNGIASKASAATTAVQGLQAAQSAASAASAATTGARSVGGDGTQSTNAMLEGGKSTDGGAHFQLPGQSLHNYQLYGYPLGDVTSASAWNDLLTETADAALQAKIRGDAHTRHIPGFATGGSFLVGGSGGLDSQLVTFMASPDERVTVQTPEQQRRGITSGDGSSASGGGTQRPIFMTINTPDANSFRRSTSQILLELRSKLNQVG